jgi:hypothetical protein
VAGSYKHDNEHFISSEAGNLPSSISDCHLLRKKDVSGDEFSEFFGHIISISSPVPISFMGSL